MGDQLGRGRLVALACVALLGAVSFVPAAEAAAGSLKRCNGHAELCARTLDEVALAGTHNSMSYPAAGFAEVAQGRSIREQLGAGIRAFLIDVYQGTPGTGLVCTDPTPLKVAQLTRDFGKEAVDSLIAVRNAEPCPPAGSPTSGLYLCHDFCESGASRFVDELGQIRSFLKVNRGEIVVLVLEDSADAASIAEAFNRAGLAKLTVTPRSGGKWPTLGKMVSTNKRLVVFSENQGGKPPWLLPAFQHVQDTPFDFATTNDFSCAPNRGPPTASLFLLNHWLGSPDAAATAVDVNSRARLLERTRRCTVERGHIPNIVAVNFAESGDVVAAVDELNRAAPTH